jgi:pimeloyl-ACP methyl ester carboxylesterase
MFSSELRENFDIVGWDPRGVGYSSSVYCVDDAGMDDYLYGVPDGYADMTEDELLAYQQAKAAAFGDSCYENTGPLLEYVDTKSTVQDLDMLRYVVGEGSALNYFGFSYGTDIGAQYIDMFPEQVGRVVLDGATDPTVPTSRRSPATRSARTSRTASPRPSAPSTRRAASTARSTRSATS